MSLFRRKIRRKISYELSEPIMKTRGNLGGFREFFAYLEGVIEEGQGEGLLDALLEKSYPQLNDSPIYINGYEINDVQFDVYSDDDSGNRLGINIRIPIDLYK